jgi:hypothetical protein
MWPVPTLSDRTQEYECQTTTLHSDRPRLSRLEKNLKCYGEASTKKKVNSKLTQEVYWLFLLKK